MQLCELTLTRVRSLASEGFHLDPTDAGDLSDLLTLDHYARAMTGTPVERLRDPFLHPALTFRGITFRRLSLGAREFLETVIYDWYHKGSTMRDASTVFAMAIDNPRDLWLFETDQGGWEKQLRNWMRGCCVEREDLNAVIMALYPPQSGEEKAEQKRARNYGPLIEMLVREYGKTADYWFQEAPDAETEELVTRYLERLDAQEAAAARAAGTKGIKTNPNSLKNERRKNLFEHEDRIKERKRKAANE